MSHRHFPEYDVLEKGGSQIFELGVEVRVHKRHETCQKRCPTVLKYNCRRVWREEMIDIFLECHIEQS